MSVVIPGYSKGIPPVPNNEETLYERRRVRKVQLEDEFGNPFSRERQLEDVREQIARNRNPRAKALTRADTVRSKSFESAAFASDDRNAPAFVKRKVLRDLGYDLLGDPDRLQSTRVNTAVLRSLASDAPLTRSRLVETTDEIPSMAPYRAQVESVSYSTSKYNYEHGIHRPWSLATLHTRHPVDLGRDRKERRRRGGTASSRSPQKKKKHPHVQVGMRVSTLKLLLKGGGARPGPSLSPLSPTTRVAFDALLEDTSDDPFVACVAAMQERPATVSTLIHLRRPPVATASRDRCRKPCDQPWAAAASAEDDDDHHPARDTRHPLLPSRYAAAADHTRLELYAYTRGAEEEEDDDDEAQRSLVKTWNASFGAPSVLARDHYRHKIRQSPSALGRHFEGPTSVAPRAATVTTAGLTARRPDFSTSAREDWRAATARLMISTAKDDDARKTAPQNRQEKEGDDDDDDDEDSDDEPPVHVAAPLAWPKVDDESSVEMSIATLEKVDDEGVPEASPDPAFRGGPKDPPSEEEEGEEEESQQQGDHFDHLSTSSPLSTGFFSTGTGGKPPDLPGRTAFGR